MTIFGLSSRSIRILQLCPNKQLCVHVLGSDLRLRAALVDIGDIVTLIAEWESKPVAV